MTVVVSLLARPARPPGLARTPHDLHRFLVTLVQLAAAVGVASLFRIESDRRLVPVLTLVLVGFAVHAWLPWRWRPWLFLGLGLGAIQIVLMPQSMASVVLVGLALIALCHLPVPYGVRVALAVLALAALALLRARTGGTAFGLLGSMFMFRLFLYLYDQPHEREPVLPAQRLSYFFLLPNVVFPLFPVVDPTTYRRSWYNVDSGIVHQAGVTWIFTGLVHIIGYRLIYYHWTLAPRDVQSVGALAQFVVSGYLLYLRVSGMFHIIVGILCLFGHNVPRSHNRYFLASGFSDLWRRINIYWRDFMLKAVFYPIVLRSRSKGTGVVAAATLAVFVVSWMLHSYQWFWFRGEFPLTWQDGLFWCILGLLVALNAVREQHRPRARPGDAGERPGLRAELGLTVRTLGLFLAMSVLWSLWTSGSVGEWLALWRLSGPHAWDGTGTLLLVLAVAALAGVAVQHISGHDWTLGRLGRSSSFAHSAAVTGAGLAALLIIGLLPGLLPPTSRPIRFLASLQESRLSEADQRRQAAGYYEGLLSFELVNTALWDADAKRRMPRIENTPIWRFTGDFFDSELVPSTTFAWGDGMLRTNRWGMRDRDYSLAKPPGTYRIALVGGSEEMGIGVNNDEVAEAVLEKNLNRTPIGDQHVEILNFSLYGHFTIQRWVALERTAYRFQPDAVLFPGHDVDGEGTANFLATSVHYRKAVPFPWLRELLARAQVDSTVPLDLAKKRLRVHADTLLRWAYQQVVTDCRARGIVPVWVFVPSVYEMRRAGGRERSETRLARDAGFEIIDLTGLYAGRRWGELRLTPWDPHPNALAHRLIAEAIERHLREPALARTMGLLGRGTPRPGAGTPPARPSTNKEHT